MRPPERLLAPVVLLALMAAYALPSPYATLLPDTVRDLSASLRLARGEELALVGPPINFGPHLGPAWIWLQAIPLLVSQSITAVAVFVAMIAALKFVLLYELGRTWQDRRLGICLAAAAALPSIAVFQWHVFFHPNWVEAAIVAALVLTLRAAQRRSLPLWYLAAGAFGLAIQLHATASFYLPALLPALHAIGSPRRCWPWHLLGAAAAVMAWFLPLAFVSSLDQARDLSAGVTKVQTGVNEFRLADVAVALRTAYLDIPLAVGDTYGPQVGVPPLAWRVLLALAAAGYLAGFGVALSRAGRNRILLVTVLVALAVAWVIACAVRTYTSYYLCYFALPLSYVALGLALEASVSSSRRWLGGMGVASVAATLLCAVIASAGAARSGASAILESELPALGDLKHPSHVTVRARFIGASARDGVARFLCARGGTASVHGDLAFVLAASTNLDLEMHCPRRTEITMLGRESPAWTAVAPAELPAIGRTTAAWAGGLALFPVESTVTPEAGRPIERDWYQFDQLRDPQPVTQVARRFTTEGPWAVMVFRLKPFSGRWEDFSITRNGRAASPALSTYASAIYLGEPGRNDWRIEFRTDAPQWVDVHVF